MFAPVTVKLKVLRTCVNSALLYSCETWGSSSLVKLETIHRNAIRIALSLKRHTPNVVLYTESGMKSLKGAVYKRQYKFWSKILKDIEDNPHSPISEIYKQAIKYKLPYVKHYMNLHNEFNDADECMSHYENTEKLSREQNIREKANTDPGGILGTYSSINSTLVSPMFYHSYLCSEYERKILTKYRTGGHRLRIQTGRFGGVSRDQRMCRCDDDIQSLHHVLFTCTLTESVRMTNFNVRNLEEFFVDTSNAAEKLNTMEAILGLRW